MIVLALILAMAGCGAKSAASGSSSSTLTIGLNDDGQSLNPADANDGYNHVMLALAYEPLINNDSKGYVPGLATSWQYVGTGNKTFEFTLRHDARYSDGTAVTAQTVKTWLEYWVTKSPIAGFFLPGVQSIDTVGQWTVVLHLSTPNPNLVESLWTTAGMAASPKAVANPSVLSDTTAGAGPYILVPSQTVIGSTYTFEPNKYYFDQSAIKFKSVVVKIFSTATSMLQAAQTGQVNVAFGDPSTASAATGAGLTVASAPSQTWGLVYLANRAGKSPLADVRVRQALNYALNRAAITKAIAGSYGIPTSELTTTTAGGQTYKNYYPYDPQKAKALLTAAGYPHGFTMDLNTNAADGNLGTPLAEAVAQDLAQVGVTLQIKTAPTSVAWDKLAGGTSVDASSGPLGIISMPLMYTVVLSPQAYLNPFKVNDPVANTLYAQGSAATDPSPYWQQLAERMTSQAVGLPVLEGEALWYASKNIGGVVPTLANVGTIDPLEIYPK